MELITIASNVIDNPGNMSNIDMLILFGVLAAVAFFSYAIAILRLLAVIMWAAVSTIIKYIVIGALVALAVWAGGIVLRLIAHVDKSTFNGKVMKVVDALKGTENCK